MSLKTIKNNTEEVKTERKKSPKAYAEGELIEIETIGAIGQKSEAIVARFKLTEPLNLDGQTIEAKTEHAVYFNIGNTTQDLKQAQAQLSIFKGLTLAKSVDEMRRKSAFGEYSQELAQLPLTVRATVNTVVKEGQKPKTYVNLVPYRVLNDEEKKLLIEQSAKLSSFYDELENPTQTRQTDELDALR